MKGDRAWRDGSDVQGGEAGRCDARKAKRGEAAAVHETVPHPARRATFSRRRPQAEKGLGYASRSRAAAASGVRSRCGEPSISKPTMNFFTVAERRSGG